MPSITTLFPSLTIILYHLWRILLTPIAYVCNTSFLLHHPHQLFPLVITPRRNTTIHSFTPSEAMVRNLLQHNLLPPPERHWSRADQLRPHVQHLLPITRALTLDTRPSGPLIQQGTFITHQGSTIFIQEELGRWPMQEDYLTTIAVNTTTHNKFILFVPLSFISQRCVNNDSLPSPFQNPLSLHEAITKHHQLTPSPYKPISNV